MGFLAPLVVWEWQWPGSVGGWPDTHSTGIARGDLLLEPLAESLRLGAIRSAADDVEVVAGALGDRAEVLGAVALVLRHSVGC